VSRVATRLDQCRCYSARSAAEPRDASGAARCVSVALVQQRSDSDRQWLGSDAPAWLAILVRSSINPTPRRWRDDHDGIEASFISEAKTDLTCSQMTPTECRNQFGTNIHQDLIEAQYLALTDRSRQVDGAPTSLLDLGYTSAGIDDGWQKCNAGPAGVGFHDTKGRPIVDTAKFPNMKAMTVKARSLGITPGWCTHLSATRSVSLDRQGF
jgi:hypothetical protein